MALQTRSQTDAAGNGGRCSSESERVGVFQYGDDFVALRTRSQTLKFRDELGKESVVVCWDQGKTWETVL